MKVITSNVSTLFTDANAKAKVIDLLNGIGQTSSTGGMTIGIGSGRPIVVCMGKPSLADEKSLRADLRKLDDKIKLSRTNDVTQRCEQYDIARDAGQWRKLAGIDAKDAAKSGKKTSDTPIVTEPPAVTDTAVEQPVEQTGIQSA